MTSISLERYIFVGNFGATAGRGLGDIGLGAALVEAAGRRLACSGASAVAAFAAAFARAAAAQQHQVVDDDLGLVLFLAGLLVVPGIAVQATFDVDLAALLQVFAGNLR